MKKKKKFKPKNFSVKLTTEVGEHSELFEKVRQKERKKLVEQLEQGLYTEKKKKKAKIIFVFGSNLAGRHGKGAAKTALEEYGAIYGVGKGRMGNSYAIPTKDKKLRPLPLEKIRYYVNQFLHYAYKYTDRGKSTLTFRVTPIGCGLAGYKPEQIAPMFLHSPSNVILPRIFHGKLGEYKNEET